MDKLELGQWMHRRCQRHDMLPVCVRYRGGRTVFMFMASPPAILPFGQPVESEPWEEMKEGLGEAGMEGLEAFYTLTDMDGNSIQVAYYRRYGREGHIG